MLNHGLWLGSYRCRPLALEVSAIGLLWCVLAGLGFLLATLATAWGFAWVVAWADLSLAFRSILGFRDSNSLGFQFSILERLKV